MAIECKHGRLARKCEHCELDEALARISALEAENAKLREAVSKYSGTLGEETQKRYVLEAERNKAVELLRTECLCYEFSAACSRCKQKHVFLASIGGEGK